MTTTHSDRSSPPQRLPSWRGIFGHFFALWTLFATAIAAAEGMVGTSTLVLLVVIAVWMAAEALSDRTRRIHKALLLSVVTVEALGVLLTVQIESGHSFLVPPAVWAGVFLFVGTLNLQMACLTDGRVQGRL